MCVALRELSEEGAARYLLIVQGPVWGTVFTAQMEEECSQASNMVPLALDDSIRS